MAGHFSVKMLKSTTQTAHDAIASERWNVEKERQKMDEELANFHKTQLERCKLIRIKSNTKAVDIYEKLLFKIRWANPNLPIRHRNLVVDYCEHLLGPHSNDPYPKLDVLKICNDISVGTPLEKASYEIEVMYNKIKDIAEKRDKSIISRKGKLIVTTEKAIVKNEGKLRWMMETNVGRKDRYWTVWFLASRAMVPELTRILKSGADVNERDPDFGMTALHYACKRSDLDVVTLLIDHGADILATTVDGRTPLHLAAQYGSKEIVGHLLCLGAFYEAKDKYGCMAIDLADQNKNKATFDYLDHWNKLIPPEPPRTPPPEEDLSVIPEEYLATPKHIFDKMSLRLQILTKRLDGEGLHSFGVHMDTNIELRLCEKHSLLCIQEGFLLEGIKSLRRRWKVAKAHLNPLKTRKFTSSLLLNSSAVTAAPTVNIDTAVPNSNVDIQAPTVVVKERTMELESLAFRALANISEEPEPVVPAEVSSSRRTGASVVVNEGVDEASVLPDLPAAIQLEYPTETSAEEKADIDVSVEASAEATGVQLGQLTVETGLGATVDPNAVELSTNSVLDIGRDLAEVLIKNQFDGFAYVVYLECLSLPNLDPFAKMTLCCRVCDLVLFLYDAMNKKTFKESSRTTFIPPSHRVHASSTSAAGSSTFFGTSETASEPNSPNSGLPTLSPGPGNRSFSMQSGPLMPGSAISGSISPNHDKSQRDSSTSVNRGFLSALDSMSPEKSQFVATVPDPTGDKQQKMQDLLAVGHSCANEALRIHYEMHTEGFKGQDDITLVPLLKFASEMHERDFRWSESCRLLEYAEVVSSRSLGPEHEETIRLMLLGVKLHLKCANTDAYKTASKKAMDMSRRLDKLAISQPEAADKLGRQCAEVMALSRLLEELKDDPGDELSLAADSSVSSAVSKRAAVADKASGGYQSSSARTFIAEVKNISKQYSSRRSEATEEICVDIRREQRKEAKKRAWTSHKQSTAGSSSSSTSSLQRNSISEYSEF